MAGVLAALALWQAAPGRNGPSAPVVAASLRADPGRAPAAPVPAATSAAADASATSTHVTRAIERALDRHIEAAGLADRVAAADRAALRDALLDVRRASTRTRRRSHDPAWQAEQSRVLVAADRVFRNTLGIGLSDFMADAGPPGRIEDLGRPRS
jgi:hypothetical protein